MCPYQTNQWLLQQHEHSPLKRELFEMWESIVLCLIRLTKCIRWNSFLFTGSIVPISPVLWPKTWDIVYNKSNKSDDLHLKIGHQKTQASEETERDPSRQNVFPVWPAAVQWLSLASLCQGQDPVKGQQLFSLREMSSAGQKLSELNRSITNYGHEVYFN